MIKVFGELYYIDFIAIDKFLILAKKTNKGPIVETEHVETFNKEDKLIGKTITTTSIERNQEINAVRYDILRGFLADISDGDTEDDEAMGNHNMKKMSVPFKLAFNTLYAHGIIVKA